MTPTPHRMVFFDPPATNDEAVEFARLAGHPWRDSRVGFVKNLGIRSFKRHVAVNPQQPYTWAAKIEEAQREQ